MIQTKISPATLCDAEPPRPNPLGMQGDERCISDNSALIHFYLACFASRFQ